MKKSILYIVLVLGVTWILQFMPIILNIDISNTSISSFDISSIFFTIGGLMPTLIGLIFIFKYYKKDKIKDFIKRCFIPNKKSLLVILISLLLIIVEVFITQIISKLLGGSNLGFEGLKLIIKNPLYIFYFLFWGLISGPLSEEIGWRGFLMDSLWDKNKITKNAIIIGFIWGIWHLPLYFYPAQIQYEWFNISPILGLGFIINCITNSLVYTSMYVLGERKIFPIFFLHMFENIILTGAMIYPFSDIYKIVVVPVTIVIDILFYLIFTKTKLYKNSL